LVTTLVRVCRGLTRRSLKPIAVNFVHRDSGEASELEKFLGCPIEFGADTDSIIFDRDAAQLHVVTADPYLNEMLLYYCKQALAHRRSNFSSVRTRIENAITTLLPHGKPKRNAVAQKLGMSSRTLARRLTAEGLSFGEILNQLRSDLAKRYLSEGKFSISEVAWFVGYSGVSAFSHSCKRWTGLNPRKMRHKLLASRERSPQLDALH
jgi:AraC-like DNA-binding protein